MPHFFVPEPIWFQVILGTGALVDSASYRALGLYGSVVDAEARRCRGPVDEAVPFEVFRSGVEEVLRKVLAP